MAKADGSKANTAIRVMLAATEWIIRCFAVFARYLPEVLLCSLFLVVPVVVSPVCLPYYTLYAIHHHASNIEFSRQQQQYTLQRARCIIPALGQPRPSKQSSSASKHRPAAHHRSGGVIPVTSRFLSLSLALGEQAIRQNHRQPSQQSPARSKHTAHLRTAPATPPRPPPPPPPAPSPRPRARARTTRSIITQKHPLAARPCKNGRRRARYAHPQSYLPPIAVRLPPAPAHSLVKMPNASAAPVSLLPLPPTSPKHARISHLTPSVQTSAALLSACLAHRLHKH